MMVKEVNYFLSWTKQSRHKNTGLKVEKASQVYGIVQAEVLEVFLRDTSSP